MGFDNIFFTVGAGFGGYVRFICSALFVFTKKNEAESLAWAEGNEPTPSKMPLIQGFPTFSPHNLALKHVKNIKAPKYRSAVGAQDSSPPD